MRAAMKNFFFSSRVRPTRCYRDWSSDVCSSDLEARGVEAPHPGVRAGDVAAGALRGFGDPAPGAHLRNDSVPLVDPRGQRQVAEPTLQLDSFAPAQRAEPDGSRRHLDPPPLPSWWRADDTAS